ncbi:MAG TPA: response regulator [Burkholderiaceae bacterium]
MFLIVNLGYVDYDVNQDFVDTPSGISMLPETLSDPLTTGEAAKVCGVHLRTVLRWIERGWLRAYQLPGRGDHRVTVEELRRFMLEHHIPDRTRAAGAQRRALIVDDEPAMAHAIERVLKRAGFSTAVASNGFVAGTMLYSFRPAIMTLDLKMPGMDGLAVLRFLQQTKLPEPLKIVVISADSNERMEAARALGADAVLCKPVANRELIATVERLCPTVDRTGC